MDLAIAAGSFSKERICGTATIPEQLAEGKSVDSIRGIKWNAIFKTVLTFLEHKEKDIAEVKVEVKDLEAQVRDILAEIEANKVPDMPKSKIKDLIRNAVKGSFDEVYRAQDKLCWLGSMEPNDKANEAFGAALGPLLEDMHTDISTVQQTCLGLLIKGDAYVNMCDELCNMMGQTTATEVAKAKRVKTLSSLQDRIDLLRDAIQEKQDLLAALVTEKDECKADEAALNEHKASLGGLSTEIKDEKVKLFMAWNAMTSAEDELTALTADNEKLRENTEELDKLLADADSEKTKIKDDLKKLALDERDLNKDLDIQSRQAKDVDATVKRTGEAIEVVNEFKFTLERMVLVWNEFYTKSVVEPLQGAEAGFSNNADATMELKKRIEETAKGLADFCGQERTKAALAGVPKLADLPLICDKQIQNWMEMSSSADEVVRSLTEKQAAHIAARAQEAARVDEEGKYQGPPREGVRAEVKGVWPTATYFRETLFVSSYLRGWKTLADSSAVKAEDLDGRWVRLCEQLYREFQAAVAEQKKAQDLLAKTQDDFKKLLAELEQVNADLADAADKHALAQDEADKAKDKLANMLKEEEEMQQNLLGLADAHQTSLDALKRAEQAYIGTNAEAVSA